MANGTYEFTSMPLMKNWYMMMIATDMARGAMPTSFCAWAARS